MTMQRWDSLNFKRKRYNTDNNFLYPYLELDNKDYDFVMEDTGCWRGYECECTIEDNRLYLSKIKANISDVGNVNLNYFFPSNKKVFAYWYSGDVIINYGKILKWLSFRVIYEKKIALKTKNGIVLSRKVYVFKDDKYVEIERDEFSDEFFEPVRDFQNDFIYHLTNENTFPQIYLPSEVSYIEDSQYPFLEPRPIPSEPKNKNLDRSDLAKFLDFILIISAIFFFVYQFISILFFLGISFFMIYDFIKNKRKYQKDILEYGIRKKNIITENEKKLKKKNDLIISGNLIEYKRLLLFKASSNYAYNSLIPERAISITKGRFENRFKKLLIDTFEEECILTDISFPFRGIYDTYSDYNTFTPDITYKDDSICIDIEIDEPYTLNYNPIHTLGDEKEIFRNSFFNNNNWFVVRFSENQIATDSYSCVKLIAYIIARYTGNSVFLDKLLKTNGYNIKVTEEKRWDALESNVMMRKRTRDETLRKSII